MVLRGFFNDDATGNAIAIDLYIGKDANNKIIFASQNAAEDAIGMRIWIEIPVTATSSGDDAYDWATEGNTDLIPNNKLNGLLSQIMAGTNITIDDSTSGQITIAASGGGGTGDITSIITQAGSGLQGGADTGDVTLRFDFDDLTLLTSPNLSGTDLFVYRDLNSNTNPYKAITKNSLAMELARW